MARTDDDSWDISESVGATALGVAAGRAAETNSAHPLINDPYAQLFLEAAGDGIWSMYLRKDLPGELAEVDPRFKERMDAMMGYTASHFVFRRILCGGGCRRDKAGRDFGGRSGCPRLAAELADRVRGV